MLILQAQNELSQPALLYIQLLILKSFYWLQASPAACPSSSDCRFYDSLDRNVDGSTPTQTL